MDDCTCPPDSSFGSSPESSFDNRRTPTVFFADDQHDQFRNFANSLMEDIGGEDEWTVSTGVSLESLTARSRSQDDWFISNRNEAIADISSPHFPFSLRDDEPSEGSLARRPPDLNYSYSPKQDDWSPGRRIVDSTGYQNISEISSPNFRYSLRDDEPSDVSLTRPPPNLNYSPEPESDYEGIGDISPPDMDSDYGMYLDDVSQPTFDQDGSDPSLTDAIGAAENPSNISVYDAEELNKTTAPRNSDISVPRNRVWQSMFNALNYMEEEEDDTYNSFVEGLHRERREFENTLSST